MRSVDNNVLVQRSWQIQGSADFECQQLSRSEPAAAMLSLWWTRAQRQPVWQVSAISSPAHRTCRLPEVHHSVERFRELPPLNLQAQAESPETPMAL